MTHPSPASLALYAGGEVGVWRHWLVERHLAGCPDCRGSVDGFRSARERLQRAGANLPNGLNWGQLSAEMAANIRVGLAAGQCVGPVAPRVLRPRWQRAVLLAPVVLPLIAILVLVMQFGRPRLPAQGSPWVEGTVIQATADGIELKQGDRMLSLRHPGQGEVTYSANAQGTIRARYVDSETGQVTINNVYAQ
jgi:hypothetical protein